MLKTLEKNNYAEWVLRREGMKAYHDKVEPYIERDISKIEVGDIIIADGHVLNFQVINPFTGKPTRATLVGFLDWKSTALVGYEIMMTESTQCIATSTLRNAFMMKKRFGQVKTYNDWLKPYLVSNTMELLDKEIPKLKNKIKSVQLCFSSDPFMYQYSEIEQMSIEIIKKLNNAGIKCSILTKGILPVEQIGRAHV